ncbi:MAG: 3-dehydroquinate dehydratase [Candidatus Tokpelaia hoelldobleri]|uniref:3-dehydroquinate dehydratase n=1 Tax=Candidatus Tokpelaia hoelldobleri TaxID=1902579 RepID=A0A1U9JVG6_9HYPH|nr:MAG: 3-dehydroquinate dehydratase [Candidatus Tokpelaia hoelldoblerii]
MSGVIYIVNGPNLNLLGAREPDIYGHETLDDVHRLCEKTASASGLKVKFLQSNAEHQLIDWIQEARKKALAIVINPAAYSHTSVAILDALKSFDGIVAEVHLSNIHRRESFRHRSFVSTRADCVIAGCGISGYRFAIEFIAQQHKNYKNCAILPQLS